MMMTESYFGTLQSPVCMNGNVAADGKREAAANEQREKNLPFAYRVWPLKHEIRGGGRGSVINPIDNEFVPRKVSKRACASATCLDQTVNN